MESKQEQQEKHLRDLFDLVARTDALSEEAVLIEVIEKARDATIKLMSMPNCQSVEYYRGQLTAYNDLLHNNDKMRRKAEAQKTMKGAN